MASLKFWRRKPKPVEECETCGKIVDARKAIVITETFDDDRKLGILEGGTAMTATYCRKHDPRKINAA